MPNLQVAEGTKLYFDIDILYQSRYAVDRAPNNRLGLRNYSVIPTEHDRIGLASSRLTHSMPIDYPASFLEFVADYLIQPGTVSGFLV